jgi:hypothetical protein
MISPVIGLAVAITLAQAVPESQPAPTSPSSRVWNTLEFVPTDSGWQRLPKALKFIPAHNVQPERQVKPTPCTRMPRVNVDASVDPKIVVPLPPDASKARIRIVGEKMPTCSTR